jgi:hypothetical protein
MYFLGVNKYKNTTLLKGSFILPFCLYFFLILFIRNENEKKIQLKNILLLLAFVFKGR